MPDEPVPHPPAEPGPHGDAGPTPDRPWAGRPAESVDDTMVPVREPGGVPFGPDIDPPAAHPPIESRIDLDTGGPVPDLPLAMSVDSDAATDLVLDADQLLPVAEPDGLPIGQELPAEPRSVPERAADPEPAAVPESATVAPPAAEPVLWIPTDADDEPDEVGGPLLAAEQQIVAPIGLDDSGQQLVEEAPAKLWFADQPPVPVCSPEAIEQQWLAIPQVTTPEPVRLPQPEPVPTTHPISHDPEPLPLDDAAPEPPLPVIAREPARAEPELKFLDEEPRPRPAPVPAVTEPRRPIEAVAEPKGRDSRATQPEPPRTDLISLVVPVLNEKDSLRPLHAEIGEMAKTLPGECEIIFVDDGSTDGSWAVIRQLAAKDPRVKGVRFRRNFGKAAALSAGFNAARGGVVVTMDADLQDDPKEVPRFLAALTAGLDVVSGWKQVRHDPWHKTMPSRVFNGMVGVVTGVSLHDHNCGMKAYRAEVLREVHLYGEMHRFVPVLAAGRGFRVGELVINHRPRRFGRSKYGWRRFVKGFLDLLTVRFLTGFGRRPQHLLGSLGLVNWSLGLLGLGVLVLNGMIRWIWGDVAVGASGQMILAMLSLGAFLFGAQLLTAGLLSELFIARGLVETEQYSVAERTDPIEL